jgi:hypothetical protein
VAKIHLDMVEMKGRPRPGNDSPVLLCYFRDNSSVQMVLRARAELRKWKDQQVYVDEWLLEEYWEAKQNLLTVRKKILDKKLVATPQNVYVEVQFSDKLPQLVIRNSSAHMNGCWSWDRINTEKPEWSWWVDPPRSVPPCPQGEQMDQVQ